MSIFQKGRSAFTMLELVFVVVILGIVTSIGSEIIVRVYEQYILQRAQYRATMKTELVAQQIANRLQYALPRTIYRLKDSGGGGITKEPIEQSLAGISSDNYAGIQWVGYDADGFNASTSDTNITPAWSGICDINSSTQFTIVTPGSNFTLANTIIGNLSGGTKDLNSSALYFPYDTEEKNISANSGNTFTIANNTAKHIAEQYRLAWSSYAVVCENGHTNFCGDLYLYYNFTPSPAANYTNASKSLLLRNVTTFKFQGHADDIRFKVCKEEAISEDYNITACKEKVVFR